MQRLTTRPQFQATMAGGTVGRTAHFALHRLVLGGQGAAAMPHAPTGTPHPLFAAPAQPAAVWLGALVPKRWARRAVTRNAIRRQIYAVAQDYAAQLPADAHVVRLRSSFDRAHFVSASSQALKQAVRAELRQLFDGAVRRSHGARRAAEAAP